MVSKTRQDDPLERDIEKAVKDYARKRGWIARKWSSPGNAGVPDDLFFREGVLVIIEFKKRGKKPTPKQRSEHRRLRNQGFEVHVIDNKEDGKALFDRYEQSQEDLGL